MQAIKIPNISDKQIMTGEDWKNIISLPATIMRMLLYSALYQECGHGSAYITTGFQFQNYSPDRHTIKLGPGIAVLNDILVSSDSDEGHYIMLPAPPDDGDILVLGYSMPVTPGYAERHVVDDVTRADNPDNVMSERIEQLCITNQYIPKFRIAKTDELIDSRYEIPYLAYMATTDTFFPIVSSEETLKNHKTVEIIDHQDESIPTEKLTPLITGRQTTTTAADNLQTLSSQIFGLMGKLPGMIRIGRHITTRGEWVTSTPGYWGIDDIVYAIATEIVQKGRNRSLAGGDVHWTDLAYDSEYTPCIGWVNPQDGKIYLNPAAFFHIAPGARYAARCGIISGAGWIDAVLDSSNSRPVVFPSFDFPLEKIYYFASMKFGTVRTHQTEGDYDNPDEDWRQFKIQSSNMLTQISPRAVGQAGHSPGGGGQNEFFISSSVLHLRGTTTYDFVGDSNYFLIGVL